MNVKIYRVYDHYEAYINKQFFGSADTREELIRDINEFEKELHYYDNEIEDLQNNARCWVLEHYKRKETVNRHWTGKPSWNYVKNDNDDWCFQKLRVWNRGNRMKDIILFLLFMSLLEEDENLWDLW